MSQHKLSDLDKLDACNAEYVESLLAEYLSDVSRVPQIWQDYFQRTLTNDERTVVARRGPPFPQSSIFNPPAGDRSVRRRQHSAQRRQRRVDQLIRAYRAKGHLSAKLDPLDLAPRDGSPLDPQTYELTSLDDDQQVCAITDGDANRLEIIGELRKRLARIYCGSIGFEYMHINDRRIRQWLQDRIEDAEHDTPLTRDDQLRILTRLTDAVIFEQFVRKKYVGAKTFSLEGAETLIPLLDLALEVAVQQGISEFARAGVVGSTVR